jgi:hypothetical protein
MYIESNFNGMYEHLDEDFFGKRAGNRRRDARQKRIETKANAKVAKATAKANGTAPSFADKAGGFLKSAASAVGGVLGKNTESVDIGPDGLKAVMKEDANADSGKFTKMLPFIIGGVVLLAVVAFFVLRKK